MFCDIHAHVHVREFDADREEVLRRAHAEGVGKIINVGFDIEGNYQALALAKKYPFVYATMGIHPHLASEWSDEVGRKIFELVKREEKIVALGEMGLDFYKNFQPREIQQKAFEGQLTLAQKLDLPVIIHCRDAFNEVFSTLKKYENLRVLLHCFTGSLEIAKKAWKRGYATSFTGIFTYPTAQEIRGAVKHAPLEKIFFETDCPFLAPQGHRGKRNEPAFVKEIYQKASEIRKIPLEELEGKIEENLKSFFGI